MAMTANMGSPNNPEGLPHWTAKSLMAHRLRRGMQNSGRCYGAPFSRQLRNVAVPDGLDAPQGLETTLEHLSERVDSISPLAFAIFDEPSHDACVGGAMVVNLLEGMRNGEVKCEESFGDFLPDIALYREDASTPHVVIEVEHTNPPSERKIGFYKAEGVVAFALNVNGYTDVRAAVHRTVVEITALTNPPCGRALREEIMRLDRYITDKHESGEHPFVGIKAYPSGTQEYIAGIYDPLKDEEWQNGEPEVMGFCPTPVRWNSPPRITPLEQRSLTKRVFLAYMVISLERCVASFHISRSAQEKSVFFTLGNYAKDLLDAVHVPG